MMLRQHGTNTPFSVASWFLWCAAGAPSGATVASSALEEATEVADDSSSGCAIVFAEAILRVERIDQPFVLTLTYEDKNAKGGAPELRVEQRGAMLPAMLDVGDGVLVTSIRHVFKKTRFVVHVSMVFESTLLIRPKTDVSSNPSSS